MRNFYAAIGSRAAPDDNKAASALGGAVDGMMAEQVCLNAEGLVHIPEHLSFEEAATLPCAAVTAWHALFHSGGSSQASRSWCWERRRFPVCAAVCADGRRARDRDL